MTDYKEKRSQLDALTEALVNDILTTPDAELLNEVRESGGDPAAIAKKTRAAYAAALVSVGKNWLAAAKTAAKAERDAATDLAVTKLDPAAARARLNALLDQHPETRDKLTLAARKGQGLSDSDVESMLQDLAQLGVPFPQGKDR